MNDFLSYPSTVIDPNSVFDHTKFVNVLQKILKDKTQLEFSKQSGLSNATISRILTGNRTNQPYKSTVDKIASTIEDPELIKELYDAAGYSDEKLKEREQIIADNGFSPDLTTLQIHEKFFSALMRGLSLMTDLHNIEWTMKSGTPKSSAYLIKLENTDIDYWYIRFVDPVSADMRKENVLTSIYGEFAKLDSSGKLKVSCVTPSTEDYDYYVTVPPLQLYSIASVIYFDAVGGKFAEEYFLETAFPLKEHLPVSDFCNLTEPLIL
jgi:transcriptional regulator with XRE-family HTH domain